MEAIVQGRNVYSTMPLNSKYTGLIIIIFLTVIFFQD